MTYVYIHTTLILAFGSGNNFAPRLVGVLTYVGTYVRVLNWANDLICLKRALGQINRILVSHSAHFGLAFDHAHTHTPDLLAVPLHTVAMLGHLLPLRQFFMGHSVGYWLGIKVLSAAMYVRSWCSVGY